MGVGPNYVLDKGFLMQGTAAVTLGMLVKDGTVDQSVALAGTGDVLGVLNETVDATRVATGKVFIDVRLLGISRVLCGDVVTKGDRLVSDATHRAVKATQAGAAAVPVAVFGRALTTSTAAGQYIDVLLTPGATF
jgi:hypothetical protein